jgi:hypothetical protein
VCVGLGGFFSCWGFHMLSHLGADRRSGHKVLWVCVSVCVCVWGRVGLLVLGPFFRSGSSVCVFCGLCLVCVSVPPDL